MISSADHSLAAHLKQLLTEKAEIVDFRVFGSRARGDATDDSDLDVYIEVDGLDRTLQKQLANIIWDCSIDAGVVISPLFYESD